MSERSSDPIRVCLLVNGSTIAGWEHAALKRMLADTSAEITVVVSNRRVNRRSKVALLKRAIELREWTLVWAIRTLLEDSNPLYESVELRECEYVDDATWIDCVPETVDGWKNAIPTDVVSTTAAEADVGVRFGFGFLVGDVLTELEHGVVSFHHGDLREYRGQPAGCWEFLHGADEVGITLQRITERLDAGEIVVFKSIPITDARTHSEIRDRLYANSEDVLAAGIAKLEDGQTEFETVEELGDLYTIPRGIPALRYLFKELRGKALEFVEE